MKFVNAVVNLPLIIGLDAGGDGPVVGVEPSSRCQRPAETAIKHRSTANYTLWNRSPNVARSIRGSAFSRRIVLYRVAKGFFLAILVATPLGFILGLSTGCLSKMLDPIIQVLRPISPLAWLPLWLIVFRQSKPAALFTIALCSMWPTVINTMAGVRSVPQDYWNVAKVLRLSPWKTFIKVLVPATLPHMFTGYRLSLGIAWLVIVAGEMLTGSHPVLAGLSGRSTTA